MDHPSFEGDAAIFIMPGYRFYSYGDASLLIPSEHALDVVAAGPCAQPKS